MRIKQLNLIADVMDAVTNGDMVYVLTDNDDRITMQTILDYSIYSFVQTFDKHAFFIVEGVSHDD